MAKAFRVHKVGGPEVLQWEDVTVPSPGPGEVLLRQTAVGLNFIDVYHRTGLYPLPLPFTPGMESAGVIEALGPGVSGLHVGDRVATATVIGAYAEQRVVPADKVVPIPAGVDDQTAAATMLKGMTAQYLLFQTRVTHPGETILFHAAAGATGSFACQWAKHIGAHVIGTVGSPEKVAAAQANGCDHVIVLGRDNIDGLAQIVRGLTHGRGVPVVYDSIGKDTFAASLDCLSPRGLMVLFGQASGVVPPFNLGELSTKGSLYITRPTLMHYTGTPAALAATAGATLDVVASGAVKVKIGQTFPLREAPAAHDALVGRHTTGATVLVP